jgi:tripartite-type tricarboxylate transporter receptor subunit TctC
MPTDVPARALSRRRFQTLLAAAALGSPVLTRAQGYPNQPIKVIVPYGAGGTSDAIARLLAPSMSQLLGQQLVIENRSGAGGTVGTAQVAKSAADGYTVLITLSSHAINPGLYRTLPFDTEKDLRTVTLLATGPQVLAVHPGVPATNLREYLAWAKADPRNAAYASGGQGTPGHLAAELLGSMAQTKLQHIPYRSGGAAVSDVLGGQVPAVWVTAIAAIPHIKSGKLKALAVTTSERVFALPDVPTVAESGFATYAVDAWVGMFVPAATPEPIVARLHAAAEQALNTAELKAALLTQGSKPLGDSPKASHARVQAEIQQWRTLIAARNITPE